MLENLKILLGIDTAETDRDALLELLITTATARLRLLLGGIEPPASMDHVILEVAVARFNRVGSEGMANHSVEGESTSFIEDDFAPFADEIQAFLSTQEESTRGRLRFL